eukprot:3749704-Prymnesium_polylepis.2
MAPMPDLKSVTFTGVSERCRVGDRSGDVDSSSGGGGGGCTVGSGGGGCRVGDDGGGRHQKPRKQREGMLLTAMGGVRVSRLQLVKHAMTAAPKRCSSFPLCVAPPPYCMSRRACLF